MSCFNDLKFCILATSVVARTKIGTIDLNTLSTEPNGIKFLTPKKEKLTNLDSGNMKFKII